MQIKKAEQFLLYLILITLAVSPAFALGEGNRNLLLIGVMAISPLILIRYGKLYRFNKWLLVFMASIIIIPLIHQPESMRWTTVLYSIMFCLTFLAYCELFRKGVFTPINYLNLLKYLILAYFSMLLIQQFCVLVGLPIFNVSNYSPKEPWKLNSLAAEPSHSARIMALLMYCYITIKELVVHRKYRFKLDFKKDKWLWLAFIWTMITMGSGTAFLFILIVLLKFIRPRNLFPIIIGIVLIFALINVLEITAFERTYKIFKATLTLDKDTIMRADHSASMRIVPLLVVIENLGFNTLNDWFGHGIDYTGTFLSDQISGIKKGTSGGGLLQVWMEYGFLSFFLFLIFSLFNSFRKEDLLSLVFWFMLVFLYGVNSQIVWLCIILLYTNKYFFKLIESVK